MISIGLKLSINITIDKVSEILKTKINKEPP